MDASPNRGLSAAEFFARGFEGGSMTDAHLATGMSYSTIFRAKEGGTVGRNTAVALASWSAKVDAAVKAGVRISAARTLGLDDEASEAAPDAKVA